MPWNDQRGGGKGPWGKGPQGGGGGGIQPPDLDELLKQFQSRMKSILPGGGGQNYIIGGVGALVLAVWLFSGINIIQATERGVVLRLGEYVDTLSDGIHWRFPYPIETVERVQTSQRQLEVGTELSSTGADDSLVLTGDENIVDIDFSVQWRVKDARDFAFNVDQPEVTIKAVAESAMREAAGQTQINSVLTGGRAEIQEKVRANMQTILDNYRAGVEVMDVNLLKSDPPKSVIDAFRDVQAAAADADKARNESEKYKNSKVPEARGLAAQIIQQAEAYKTQVSSEAQGEAARFNSIYEQYRNAPSVTRERMFLETMERVLGPMNKVIIDSKGNGGVQPYMALPPDLLRRGTSATGQ